MAIFVRHRKTSSFRSHFFCFSLVDEDSGSSYSSPYRSLISSTSLAASVKLDSVFSPSLIPAVLAQVSIRMFEVKLLIHNQYSRQGEKI